MIRVRRWLISPSSRLRVALATAAVLCAVVWAHGAAEGHPMPDEPVDDGMLAVCLAVLAGGSLPLLSTAGRRLVAHLARPRARQWWSPPATIAAPRPRPGPLPRAGPAALQVFLR